MICYYADSLITNSKYLLNWCKRIKFYFVQLVYLRPEVCMILFKYLYQLITFKILSKMYHSTINIYYKWWFLRDIELYSEHSRIFKRNSKIIKGQFNRTIVWQLKVCKWSSKFRLWWLIFWIGLKFDHLKNNR